MESLVYCPVSGQIHSVVGITGDGSSPEQLTGADDMLSQESYLVGHAEKKI